MPKVTVYTMEYCPYCVQAKKLLERKGIPFSEIKVADDDDAAWEALFKKSGMRTMPQIFSDDQLIGGYRELADLETREDLVSLK